MSERTKNERITELEDLVAGINSRLNSQESWIAKLKSDADTITEAQINLRKDLSAVEEILSSAVNRHEQQISNLALEQEVVARLVKERARVGQALLDRVTALEAHPVEIERLAQRVQMLEMEARATPGWAGNSNLPKGAPLPAEPNVRLSDRTNAQIKEAEALPSDPDLFHDIASYLRNGAAREDEISGHKGTRFSLYNRMIYARIICCRCLRGGKIWKTGLCTVCAANTNPIVG
jgi:hypothetical protein